MTARRSPTSSATTSCSPRLRRTGPSWKPRAATAADVKYAIERALLPGVPNGFVQNYLSGVVGMPKAIKEAQDNPTGGAPDISGITAPDDTTLVIKLNRHDRRWA